MRFLLLIATATILASCGKTKTVTQDRVVEVEKEAIDTRMVCNVFNVSAGIPDFKVLESMGTVLVSQLDSPSSDNSKPFAPFIDTEFETSYIENFGITCKGTFKAEVSGMHNIILDSDDGSTLSLNGVKLIDNNGDHGMIRKSSNIMLLAGDYKLEITYYNHSGLKGLILSAKRPNRSKEEVLKF